ncbi:hypothetical protein BU26DRAFT_563367 [Trematosphaeria pertusa]|uniref:Uncharacterized protein n=1 Tax=Trematosphaeria pertusa TaxID=390896 RepID=A0A6A6IPA9_9PLEO|nr:uncharacterized protein BU26DRAFT_563367 [Trematosphaeria pertusa]KAF2251430.1 hypothetical protein BU26DRAFT_563367 [Trematosphaeria pertusa]
MSNHNTRLTAEIHSDIQHHGNCFLRLEFALGAFTPLLKPKVMNPQAALLMAFHDVVPRRLFYEPMFSFKEDPVFVKQGTQFGIVREAALEKFTNVLKLCNPQLLEERIRRPTFADYNTFFDGWVTQKKILEVAASHRSGIKNNIRLSSSGRTV